MLKNLKFGAFPIYVTCFMGMGLASSFTSANASVNEISIVQQNVCKGVVTDANGEPIIGASVKVIGTSAGTVTDVDGKFSLPNLKKGDKIEISYVGYKSQTVVYTG